MAAKGPVKSALIEFERQFRARLLPALTMVGFELSPNDKPESVAFCRTRGEFVDSLHVFLRALPRQRVVEIRPMGWCGSHTFQQYLTTIPIPADFHHMFWIPIDTKDPTIRHRYLPLDRDPITDGLATWQLISPNSLPFEAAPERQFADPTALAESVTSTIFAAEQLLRTITTVDQLLARCRDEIIRYKRCVIASEHVLLILAAAWRRDANVLSAYIKPLRDHLADKERTYSRAKMPSVAVDIEMIKLLLSLCPVTSAT